MIASPINPSDLIPVMGAYSHRIQLPFVPGYEGIGRVEDVARGEDRDLMGSRVLPLDGPGCWQQWKIADAHRCVLVPDDITDDEAATAYINPLTAILMLDDLEVHPGARVGITAAGSTIGRMLVRILSARGIEPIAIVRTPRANHDELREFGEVLLENHALPQLDAGLDAVGGAVAHSLARAIRPGGSLVHYGLLSGQPLTNPGHAKLKLFRLKDRVNPMSQTQFHSAISRCFEEIRQGRARTDVRHRYRVREFRDALTRQSLSQNAGKIILDLY